MSFFLITKAAVKAAIRELEAEKNGCNPIKGRMIYE